MLQEPTSDICISGALASIGVWLLLSDHSDFPHLLDYGATPIVETLSFVALLDLYRSLSRPLNLASRLNGLSYIVSDITPRMNVISVLQYIEVARSG